MRVVTRVVSVLVVVLSPFWVSAQFSDSTVVLDELVLESTRLSDYQIQGFAVSIDSTTLSRRGLFSLGELIQVNGIGLLRAYSPGGVSTASIRGTGSNHTALVWNGISIESPQNGQNDLSQIPLTFFNAATITSGGNAALFGNGSIGGTIQLENRAQFSKGLGLSGGVEAGSFGRAGGRISASFSNRKVSLRTSVMHRKARNNFTYEYGNETRTWQHANQILSGFNQTIDWQLNNNHYVYARVWMQNQDYEVPNPSTVVRPGTATQEDKALRSMLGYLFSASDWEIRFQSAYLRQILNYEDPQIQLESESQTSSFIQQLEATRHFNKTDQLTLGTHYIHELVETNNFRGTPGRNRWILAGAYQFTPVPKVNVALSVREEIINGKTTPVAPGVKIQWKPVSWAATYITANRSYRIPTFNDLYWSGAGGAGNPGLNPELSTGGEIGGTFSFPFVQLQLAGYSQRVDDWIQWVPEDGSVWTPINLKEVWARGVESKISSTVSLSNFTLNGSASYRFTKSTTEEMYSDDSHRTETGNQLILVPVHSGNVSLNINHPWLSINYTHAIYGAQYTDDDNSDFRKIPAYGTGTLELNKNFNIKQQHLNLNLRIQNILDAEYVARPGFPMPGRNFLLGLSFDLTTSKN